MNYQDIRPLIKASESDQFNLSDLSGNAIAELLQDIIRAKLPTFSMSQSTRDALIDLLDVGGLERMELILRYIRTHNTAIISASFIFFLFMDFRRATAEIEREFEVPEESGADQESSDEPKQWTPEEDDRRPQPQGFAGA